MDSIADFLAMGGYGAYVWSAFALSALVLGGLAVASVASLRRNERALKTLESVAGARRRRGPARPGTPAP